MSHIKKYLEGIVGAVEASSFERLCLWKDYTAKGISWDESGGGWGVTVGAIKTEDLTAPVCISITTTIIDGQKILFFEPTSRVVDHQLIELWLEDNAPSTAFLSSGSMFAPNYVNVVDAMNFHNVFRRTR
jgi:hypothetical protein